jgi:hypothetical protein
MYNNSTKNTEYNPFNHDKGRQGQDGMMNTLDLLKNADVDK